MEAQVETLSFLAREKKDNNQSKTNKQPELPENQTAWNSNKQGGKETFTRPVGETGSQGDGQGNREGGEDPAQQGGESREPGGAG